LDSVKASSANSHASSYFKEWMFVKRSSVGYDRTNRLDLLIRNRNSCIKSAHKLDHPIRPQNGYANAWRLFDSNEYIVRKERRVNHLLPVTPSVCFRKQREKRVDSFLLHACGNLFFMSRQCLNGEPRLFRARRSHTR